MNDINTSFSRTMLQAARMEAKKLAVTVPKNITALRSGRDQWFVEADGLRGEYVKGDNAFVARANYIWKLIRNAEERNTLLDAVTNAEETLADAQDDTSVLQGTQE